MEDRKHFFEDVCIPRNEFIKEHIKLLQLLRHGNRSQLLAEAKSQEAELKGKTGMTGGVRIEWSDDPAELKKQLLSIKTLADVTHNVDNMSVALKKLWWAYHPEEDLRKALARWRPEIIKIREALKNPAEEKKLLTFSPYAEGSPHLGAVTIPAAERTYQFRLYRWFYHAVPDEFMRNAISKVQYQKGVVPLTQKEIEAIKTEVRLKNKEKQYITGWQDTINPPLNRYGNPEMSDGYDTRIKPLLIRAGRKKGGSRAAGYIKKLIAMYKDGLEVFDIKKMKWASDNLKAFGISMEEDEAPKKKAEEPKEHPAITAYNEALRESIRNSSGMSLARMDFSLTKAENEEMKQLEMQMKEKARSIKTQDEIKAFNKEQKRVLDSFKDRVKKRYREEEARLAELKKASDEAKGMKLKPMTISEGKSFSFGTDDSRDILGAFYNRSKPAPASSKMAEMKRESERAVDFVDKPDWRRAAGYEDPIINKYGVIQNEHNVNSQLPSDYKPDDGWDWLASKYGKLYDIAIDKVKELTRKGRPSFSDKERKEFVRLPFDDIPQMKEFFRDVLLADPILYQHLHLNAFRTRAPATTNALREFKKWKGK